ncbi:MAG: hypothetical protein AAF655_27070 [Bacteroidota bacterium]
MIWILWHVSVQAQIGFIHGEVWLKNGQKVTGDIRWGIQDAYWIDVFEGRKKENEVLTHLSADDIRKLSRQEASQGIEWGFMNLWENKYPEQVHSFRCRYGDIKEIQNLGEKLALLSFRDGTQWEIEGTSREHDVGKRIVLFKEYNLRIKISWQEIEKIKFSAVDPSERITRPNAYPLFGELQTTQGTYRGYIIWDQEERLSGDKLDGQNAFGRVSINFGEIAAIQKKEEGAEIQLLTGQNIFLTNHQDVNKKNKDISVISSSLGIIRVKWADFQQLQLEERPDFPLPLYQDFPENIPLTGTIRTHNGNTFSGPMIFDLDEQFGFEMIEGKQKGLLHYVSLEEVAILKRIDQEETNVLLKNGKQLILTDEHDVTDKNWGILVWQSENRPDYIPWNKVHHIKLN